MILLAQEQLSFPAAPGGDGLCLPRLRARQGNTHDLEMRLKPLFRAVLCEI